MAIRGIGDCDVFDAVERMLDAFNNYILGICVLIIVANVMEGGTDAPPSWFVL